jgi:hypothetical protein
MGTIINPALILYKNCRNCCDFSHKTDRVPGPYQNVERYRSFLSAERTAFFCIPRDLAAAFDYAGNVAG